MPFPSSLYTWGRGPETFLCQIACKKASFWTFSWLVDEQYLLNRSVVIGCDMLQDFWCLITVVTAGVRGMLNKVYMAVFLQFGWHVSQGFGKNLIKVSGRIWCEICWKSTLNDNKKTFVVIGIHIKAGRKLQIMSLLSHVIYIIFFLTVGRQLRLV